MTRRKLCQSGELKTRKYLGAPLFLPPAEGGADPRPHQAGIFIYTEGCNAPSIFTNLGSMSTWVERQTKLPPPSPPPSPSPPVPPFEDFLPDSGAGVYVAAGSYDASLPFNLKCVEKDVLEMPADSYVTVEDMPVAAQCCDEDGYGECYRHLGSDQEDCISGSPPKPTSYREAVRLCALQGLSVCKKRCSGTGCGYDNYPIWTSIPCDEELPEGFDDITTAPSPPPPLPSPPPSSPPPPPSASVILSSCPLSSGLFSEHAPSTACATSAGGSRASSSSCFIETLLGLLALETNILI